MSSNLGKHCSVSVFGESHGPAIGAVLENPPVGLPLDFDYISTQMARRAPGNDATATPRKEADIPEFLSGIKDGVTTGAPLTVIIHNKSQRSADYDDLKRTPRPSHADYAAEMHYKGFQDVSGGGHFSGRLTAPLVAVGSVLRLYLKQKGIEIGGHILRIGEAEDSHFDPVFVSGEELCDLSTSRFALLDKEKESAMREQVEAARKDNDSIGGILEIAVTGLPAGLGGPMFDGAENIISKAVFGIPAVKGIEFGDGFALASMRGSDANDNMYLNGGSVTCRTNHSGGITGGITNAMPLIFRVAIKPTPSIAKEQETVDLVSQQTVRLSIHGRHDPCIVPRALPALEAVTAIAITNLISEVCMQ